MIEIQQSKFFAPTSALRSWLANSGFKPKLAESPQLLKVGFGGDVDFGTIVIDSGGNADLAYTRSSFEVEPAGFKPAIRQCKPGRFVN